MSRIDADPGDQESLPGALPIFSWRPARGRALAHPSTEITSTPTYPHCTLGAQAARRRGPRRCSAPLSVTSRLFGFIYVLASESRAFNPAPPAAREHPHSCAQLQGAGCDAR